MRIILFAGTRFTEILSEGDFLRWRRVFHVYIIICRKKKKNEKKPVGNNIR